ncbi:MAG: hypothetical protein EOO50_05220 [Flavobacterium sp.]|uniref:phage tail tape measure protein n=1 Tax=Flavobacterium sp. TaxID=239 RepID=UPI001217C544|nr:phage tail tape measure protein [Flavobacterium sp.]RZJ67684.1 MAG: hypothetical protein EOO50_05220 [Flavobacterium sp.]
MANQVEILSLNINVDQLTKKLSETKKSIDDLQASQRQLAKEGQSSSEQFVKQAAQLQNLNTAYNSQKNVLAQVNAAKDKAKNVADALNQALHQEVETIAQATANNRQLIAIRNNLSTATKEGAQAIELINQKLDENNRLTKENSSAAEKQKQNIGNYTSSFREGFDSINIFNGGLSGLLERSKEAGGAGNLFKNSFGQMTTGIKGATTAAMQFIMTPIGAVIAGITAAFAAGKAIFDYNKGLQETNKELKALGVSAGELSTVRSEIQATAETFDKDFKDIAAKANSLAKSYGISMSEANDIIAQGLASGGAQNEEFLDSLGEYDGLFAKAGFSAQEFVNVLNTGAELGIYSDKLPDAIKEAGLSLTEQTKSTRDALVNAFGANFSDDVLKKVRTGEMTTKEALQAIAEQSAKTQLTQQQQAALTADVFRGAGEDAGGALTILQAIGQASNKTLDETAKKQLELQEATERLNKAQAELFEIKDFGDIWTNIKITATEGLAAIIEYLSDVKEDIQPLIDLVSVVLANAWVNLKTTVGGVFDYIGGVFKVLSNTIGTFFNFFKAIAQGDFQGAIDALKNGFLNLLNIVNETFGKIKNTIIDGIKGIIDNISPALDALGLDVEKINKALDSMKSKEVNFKSKTSNETANTSTDKNIVSDVDPNAAANAKAAADAAKKARDEKLKAIEAEIKKQKEAIDLFIAGQGFRKKSSEDQLKVDEQIMNKRLALNDFEYKSGKISKDAYEAAKLNLTTDYAKKTADATVENAQLELEAYKENLARKVDDEKFFSAEKLAVQLAENNSLMEMELEFQATKLENGQINEKEYLLAIDAIREENRIANEEAELERAEAKKEKELEDFDTKMELAEEQNQVTLELLLEDLENQRVAEVKAAEKSGADLNLINQKYAALEKNLRKSVEMAKMEQIASTIGQAKGLFKENTTAYKAAAIAEIGITTAKNAMSAYDAAFKPVATVASPALGAIYAGITVALGAAQIAKVAGIKFQKGGLARGKSHAQGGIPFTVAGTPGFEMEGGEAIINKRSTSKYRNLLSAINEDGGGLAFSYGGQVPTYRFANGGVTGNANLGQLNGIAMDMDSLAVKIGEQVSLANLSLPAPQVDVREISATQRSIALAADKANMS